MAGLALAGFVLALMMSASPELHKSLHHDAEEAQHECLVTLLDSGGCEGAPVVGFAVQPLPEPQPFLPGPDGIAAESFFLACSVFEHAPPVSS
jgi:hypothetical protein